MIGKPERGETSVWKGMIAREDDHSLCLFNLLTGSLSVANPQRSTDHSCICTWMFFMTVRKATCKKHPEIKCLEEWWEERKEGLVLYFCLFHRRVYERPGRLSPSANSMCSTHPYC